MAMNRQSTGGMAAAGALVAMSLLPPAAASAQTTNAPSPTATLTIDYDFPATIFVSNDPNLGLAADTNGALYGIALLGPNQQGTVFKLTPPQGTQTEWTQTDLSTFTGNPDGRGPVTTPLFGPDGALYGTTALGGGLDKGTVYRQSPLGGAHTILYQFKGADNADGNDPEGSLTFGPDGALYGTTVGGGTANKGTVYKLARSAKHPNVWVETVIYSFSGTPRGAFPKGGVIFGPDGALYGTTETGGVNNQGSVFRLAPNPARPKAQWRETVLHSFIDAPGDGRIPFSTLVFDTGGALYGVANFGGSMGDGMAFQMRPPASGKRWPFTLIHSFSSFDDGSPGTSPFIVNPDGSLFGTTSGGSGEVAGSVFKLTPRKNPHAEWTETVVHTFMVHGPAGDGRGPNPLVRAPNGVLYGTTMLGGTNNSGILFEVNE